MDLAEESGLYLFSIPLTRKEAEELVREGDAITLIKRLLERDDQRIHDLRATLEKEQDLQRHMPNELLELLGFDVWYFMGIPFTLAERRRWMRKQERLTDTLNRIVLSQKIRDPRRYDVAQAARVSGLIRAELNDDAIKELFGRPFRFLKRRPRRLNRRQRQRLLAIRFRVKV